MVKEMKKQKKGNEGKILLLILVTFFLTIFVVDGIFIYNANRSWSGVVTENGYQEGLRYNRTLEAVRQQEKLGWRADINYQVIDEKSAIIDVALKDKKGMIVPVTKMQAWFFRPTSEGDDFTADLVFDEVSKSYKSRVNFPLPGLWNLEIRAFHGGDIFQKSQRIVISYP